MAASTGHGGNTSAGTQSTETTDPIPGVAPGSDSGSGSVRLSILRAAARERLTHDLGPLQSLAGYAVSGASRALSLFNLRSRAFSLVLQAHAVGLGSAFDDRVASAVADALARERAGESTGIGALFDHEIATGAAWYRGTTGRTAADLLGSHMLVVKSATNGERGALIVDYNYVFALLPALFDLPAIMSRYFIVLEPSWSGYSTPLVLLTGRFEAPVFIETYEPRDLTLLRKIGPPFEPIFPVAANWWLDYRHSDAMPRATERDIDVVMVAAWIGYKRHWRFLQALSTLRQRGHRLKVALIGVPYSGNTMQSLQAQARYFGVDDQIQWFERIPSAQVFALLGRAKVHVLWSRREGSPRAIIEAMLADTPTILRTGFNYGHHYEHINPQTGRFAAEHELPDAILETIARRYEYSPREWVMNHMTCQHATARVDAALGAMAGTRGEPWSGGLAVKVSKLDGQEYWNPADRALFADDYRYLESTIR